MTLHKIRSSYDDNYLKLQQIIQKMGGDDKIKVHRKKRTPLYKALKQLQKREHYLNELESRLLQPEEYFQSA